MSCCARAELKEVFAETQVSLVPRGFKFCAALRASPPVATPRGVFLFFGGPGGPPLSVIFNMAQVARALQDRFFKRFHPDVTRDSNSATSPCNGEPGAFARIAFY